MCLGPEFGFPPLLVPELIAGKPGVVKLLPGGDQVEDDPGQLVCCRRDRFSERRVWRACFDRSLRARSCCGAETVRPSAIAVAARHIAFRVPTHRTLPAADVVVGDSPIHEAK